jgi:hypothetical protein
MRIPTIDYRARKWPESSQQLYSSSRSFLESSFGKLSNLNGVWMSGRRAHWLKTRWTGSEPISYEGMARMWNSDVLTAVTGSASDVLRLICQISDIVQPPVDLPSNPSSQFLFTPFLPFHFNGSWVSWWIFSYSKEKHVCYKLTRGTVHLKNKWRHRSCFTLEPCPRTKRTKSSS